MTKITNNQMKPDNKKESDEAHLPKSDGDKKFWKLHLKNKILDRNGNGDDVFNASKVPGPESHKGEVPTEVKAKIKKSEVTENIMRLVKKLKEDSQAAGSDNPSMGTDSSGGADNKIVDNNPTKKDKNQNGVKSVLEKIALQAATIHDEIDDDDDVDSDVQTKLNEIKDLLDEVNTALANDDDNKSSKNESVIIEATIKHAELAQKAHSNYIEAVRQGNSTMANYYLDKHKKHKAALKTAANKLNMKSEEVEELDEISKDLVTRYSNKSMNSLIGSSDKIDKHEWEKRALTQYGRIPGSGPKGGPDEMDLSTKLSSTDDDIRKAHKNISKRAAGISRAHKILSKEEVVQPGNKYQSNLMHQVKLEAHPLTGLAKGESPMSDSEVRAHYAKHRPESFVAKNPTAPLTNDHKRYAHIDRTFLSKLSDNTAKNKARDDKFYGTTNEASISKLKKYISKAEDDRESADNLDYTHPHYNDHDPDYVYDSSKAAKIQKRGQKRDKYIKIAQAKIDKQNK